MKMMICLTASKGVDTKTIEDYIYSSRSTNNVRWTLAFIQTNVYDGGSKSMIVIYMIMVVEQVWSLSV